MTTVLWFICIIMLFYQCYIRGKLCKMYPFNTGFSPNAASFPWDSSNLLHVSIILSFLLLILDDRNVLQLKYSPIDGHLGSFQFGATIKMIWTFMCKLLLENKFLFLWGISLRVQIAGQCDNTLISAKRNCQLFFRVAPTLYFY